MDDFIIIPMSDDPEEMAQNMIADSLPKTFLYEIDISNEQGLSRLIACLLLRQQQASLEKDELIRFVERNRKALNSGAYKLLTAMAAAGARIQGGENLKFYLEYFNENVGHLLNGHPELVNVKSDRLLWLLWALANSLENSKISYQKALSILAKPDNKERISPLSLGFMYQDYGETIGAENQPSTEYPMLILECALLSKNVAMVKVGALILAGSPAATDTQSWLDLAQRTHRFLSERGQTDTETAKFLRNAEKLSGRRIGEDDF
jgi:hypothetical protein